jgi:hypothetical protein
MKHAPNDWEHIPTKSGQRERLPYQTHPTVCIHELLVPVQQLVAHR